MKRVLTFKETAEYLLRGMTECGELPPNIKHSVRVIADPYKPIGQRFVFEVEEINSSKTS